MIVNLTKTKIVVFRREGCLKQNEKWYYNGGKIEVVSSYDYLFDQMISPILLYGSEIWGYEYYPCY